MPEELEIEQEEIGDEAAKKIKKIKEELKQCQKEKQEYLIGWQREKADFINFRRRQEEQMVEWSKMLGEGLIRDLLAVLDTLDAAEITGNEDAKRIKAQLLKILKNHGLEELKSLGEKFNHNLHEAIEQAESDQEKGKIVEETQKGYSLNGKVIRAAKVKVNK
ncbi:MAG: nucleotide exchange factor GrpE [Candidatus Portnoybacteria bacterium]|nr:nucleotide exchange factor GrpE [Candidatus Portnoybacteria bacterium]